MRIKIALTENSVQSAINQLNEIKQQIPTMKKKFLEEVAKWITKRSNEYVDQSDLGNEVKEQIKKGWVLNQTEFGISILNKAEKSVYVEFGVGIVGQSKEHPNAEASNYNYNVPSGSKFLGGYWSFRGQMESLDLPKESVDMQKDLNGFVFLTQGAKGVWYAYNAIVDAKMELAKSGGGKIGEKWEEIKSRYIN